ncbi:DUF2088 domain-containing protein [candidate division KSB1 bacterium]|nr:DUF2088 domain-containing protein [candidate division KSB1 bacterium]RQW01502.1 MAG: DUF2088 domain-containing protein [candidate division KSB1 bacterium]
MDILFPYRESGIPFRIPKNAQVFHPAVLTPVDRTYTAIIKTLLRPLGYKQTLFDIAKKCKSGCVVVDAYSSPITNRQILNPIIKTLHAAGMSHDDIIILVTSEYPSEFSQELFQSIFDQEFLRRYNVQAHDVFDQAQHEFIGKTSSGTPVHLDSRLQRADLKIITGGIYPHYLFGCAGAPLLLAFGVSGPETIQALYDLAGPENLDDFQLLNQKSKLSLELFDMLKLAELDFIVNISIDSAFRFVDIFSGKPASVIHEIADRHAARGYSILEGKADIAISCAGNSHCEMSWYHNLMSVCLARSFLKTGGTLIYITPLFDQANAQITGIRDKSDLIDFFSLNKMIHSTRAKIFSCMDEGAIVFVSPELGHAKLKKRSDRDVFFCSSVDSALTFAAKGGTGTPNILLLPDGLFTHLGLSS